jgi:signal transduction histidine kinase/DNA-binding response OmpR family regulator
MSRTVLTLTIFLFVALPLLADADRIDSLSNVLTKTEDTLKVNVLLELAAEYEYVDHEKALDHAEQARTLAKSINFKRGEVRSQYELAIIAFLKGERSEALTHLQSGLNMAEQVDDNLYQASGLFHLSHYYEEEGNYAEAINFLNQALIIYLERDQKLKISQCYSGFAGIYKTLAQYEEAIRYNFMALEIKESINDRRGISIVLSNIGGIYLLTSKLEEAEDYFVKALAMDRVNDDMEGVVYSLTRMGVVHQKMEKFDQALAYFDTALVLARELNFKIDESILLGNIGSTLTSLGKYQESLNYLFQALTIKKELRRDGSAAHTCNDICETYLRMEEFQEARKYAVLAIQLAENVDIDQYRVGLYLLADCEYALQDYQNAYDHLVQANVITDSIFTLDSETRMHEMEVRYQSEKKAQEIENLRAINETARYRNISFAGAAISFLLLGGLLYYVQRLRIRRNRQLLEKEKELDRMKSRFFANISHEFRTPLTLILGPLDGIIKKVEQTDVRKQLKVMKRNASRLLDLVNQLLDLSKIESGKLELNMSRSDIISVIKGVSMSFHSMAEQKHISLQLDVQPDYLEFNFDRAKIETILTNLLSNSFKFTREYGKISIQSAIQKVKDNSMYSIIVTDNGSGIPAEEIGQIFNRFYQSDHNQLLQQEGSGIGLALTKELVELHGGRIAVQSAPGECTQITVMIPINTTPIVSGPGHVEVSEKQTISALGDDVEFASQELLNKNQELPLILLIEDHSDVSNYVREILGDQYRVQTAEDGEQGVESAYNIIPDLILSDVMMPKMNGYEVCRALKNDAKTSHIPIILLTAKSDTEDKITGLQTRADDYITKPFVPNELLVRIMNLIESRSLLREKYRKEGVLKPKDITVTSIDEQFLNQLIDEVEKNIGNEKFGVEQLGEEVGMSRSQLHRKLTALIGESPNQFIRSFRLQRAHDLLKQKAATAAEIAYQVGFGSPSYFTKCFHEKFGYTPSGIQ